MKVQYLKIIMLSLVLLFGTVDAFGQETLEYPTKPQQPEKQTETTNDNTTTKKQQQTPSAPQPTPNASRPSNGYINGHEYVDLGLSVKWATCNIGANAPIAYGDYYLWGEITPIEEKNDTSGKLMGDIAGDPCYDVACANWGDRWRLPTKEEVQELIENCTTEWATIDGVRGMLVTSTKNGKSIFLPAAGRTLDLSLYDAGEHGLYWSSTPYEWHTYGAYYLDIDSQDFIMYWGYRNYGQSVRPVIE